MKLLFENWRNHLNEGLSPKGLEERYEKFFNPKGWYFESDQELGEALLAKFIGQRIKKQDREEPLRFFLWEWILEPQNLGQNLRTMSF